MKILNAILKRREREPAHSVDASINMKYIVKAAKIKLEENCAIWSIVNHFFHATV